MDYIVVRIDRYIAKPFVIKHHYTQAFGKASIILGLYRVGNSTLQGVITFGQCSGRLVAQSIYEGATEKTVMEFLRMVVLDECECPRTYFMSKSISILKQKYPKIKALVTYADQTEGHTGTVYKANSWKYIGQTGKKYHYTLNGVRYNKRIPWDISRKEGITEKECADKYGYIKVPELPKLKFVKTLRKVTLK